MTSLTKSKKGDIEIFMLGIIIFFLTAIIIVMLQASKFNLHDSQETLGKHALATYATYTVAEEMLLYIDTAATLAATEALGETVVSGLTQQQSACGYYAGFPLWTTPTKDCYPASVRSTYARQVPSELQNQLRLPGLPRGVDYAYTIEETVSELILKATTDAQITLPILMTKGDHQRLNSPIVMKARSVVSNTASFVADSSLPGVTTVTTKNKYARQESVDSIIIHATRTSNLQETKDKYTNGLESMHYVIGLEGDIYQFVPEDQVAYHFSECNQPDNNCNKERVEETSISVALVNSMAEITVHEEEQRLCPYGDLAVPTSWCSRQPYSGWGGTCPDREDTRFLCMSNYTDAQLDSLERLIVDIVKRKDISPSPEFIILHDQILFEDINPGPMLKSRDKTQTTWWQEFLTNVAENSARSEEQEEVYSTQKISSVVLPVSATHTNPTTITSCWGYRTLENNKQDFHDGIDFGLEIGTEVYAVAPGQVISVCSYKNPETDCKGYGSNVLIKHSNGFYSRYSHLEQLKVIKDDNVNAGQVIGLSGNSGRSFGAHLDLKFYTSLADTNNVDKGKNPMCYFSENQLQQMKAGSKAASCAKFVGEDHRFTHSNKALKDPRLGGCGGIQPLFAGDICGESPFRSDTESEKLNDAREHLDSQNLMSHIIVQANEEGVDSRLLLALIAQESGGRATVVNSFGYVGLGQIGASTAKDEASRLNEIFTGTIRSECKCAATAVCDGNAVENCEGDERLLPVKNIQGAARYLRWNIDYFSDTAQPEAFGVAAYNAGVGTIERVLSEVSQDLKKDKREITLQEVLNSIDYRTIQAALRITDEKANKAKQNEIRRYAPEVLQMYTSLGGSLSGAYQDVTCYADNTPVSVKDIGSYTFTPNFVAKVPNTIGSADHLVLDVQQAVQRCDGSTNREDCFYGLLVGATAGGFRFEYCDEITTGLHQMMRDCQLNGQDDCFCQWGLNFMLKGQNEYVSHLHGNSPYTIIDGEAINELPPNPHLAKWKQTADGEVTETPLDIVYTGGEEAAYLLTYRVLETESPEPNYERGDKIPFKHIDGVTYLPVTVYKENNELIWVPNIDARNGQQCGVVKNYYPICARAENAMLIDGEWIQPEVKVAVYIEDKHPPEAAQNVNAFSEGNNAGLCFQNSPSEDLSYYKVGCSIGSAEPSDGWMEENAKTIIAKRTVQDATIVDNGDRIVTVTGSDCEVIDVTSTEFIFKIVPYDTSGQPGDPTVISTESVEQELLDALGVGWAGDLGQLTDACNNAWTSQP